MECLWVNIDYGSSLIKLAFSIKPTNCPQYLTIEPEVIQVSSSKVEDYRLTSKVKSDPVDRTFVSINDSYYAIGTLAKEMFRASTNLIDLKSNYAVHRTLAAVFIAAHRCSIGKKFTLFLSCVLPPGELNDEEILWQDLKQALKNFDTPAGKYSVSLKYFNCHPEGGGLALFYQKHQKDSHERSLGVFMMGHRNTSFFVVSKGISSRFRSSDLGFSQVVLNIQSETSGYKERDITAIVAPYLLNKERDPAILKKLLMKKTEKSQQIELEHLVRSIDESKAAFWNSVVQWLEIQLAAGVDEIIVGGGVARIFERELTDYFADKLSNLPNKNYAGLYFNGGLKYPQGTLIPVDLHDRFADVQCLWEEDIMILSQSYLEAV